MVASTIEKISKKYRTTGSAQKGSSCFAHPPWADMITECITTTPDGTKHGVSRTTIKKFVDSKYRLPMNAATARQLSRTIAHGTCNGDFVLPRGPSGKVKLAPKRVGEPAKEIKKLPSKHPAVMKARWTATKFPVSITETKMPSFTEEQPLKTTRATRKYTSLAKKAHVAPALKRRIPACKATTKRGIRKASHLSS